MGFIAAQIITYITSCLNLKKHLTLQEVRFTVEAVKMAFNYGWKCEAGNLLQFLNYRLSYFLILHYLNLNNVGLFSVGIAIAESVWLIGKSITTVQYSKIINSSRRSHAILLTKKSAAISLYASFLLVITILIIPNTLFALTFGHDFLHVKQLFIVLIPGILSTSVSTIYAHYFSATKQQGIWIMRSVTGLIFTVILCPVLIPLWGITGACVSTTISYMASFVYLRWMFHKEQHVRSITSKYFASSPSGYDSCSR
jgi:O-antigen/teichoic acid export membrane protein